MAGIAVEKGTRRWTVSARSSTAWIPVTDSLFRDRRRPPAAAAGASGERPPSSRASAAPAAAVHRRRRRQAARDRPLRVAARAARLGLVPRRQGRALHCRLGGEPATLDGESVILGSEDNVSAIAMFTGRAAPLAPPKGLPYAPAAPLAVSPSPSSSDASAAAQQPPEGGVSLDVGSASQWPAWDPPWIVSVRSTGVGLPSSRAGFLLLGRSVLFFSPPPRPLSACARPCRSRSNRSRSP